MISLKVAMRCGDTLLFCCQRMNEHRDNSLITSFGHRTSVPLQFAFLNRSGSDDFLLAPSAAHRLIKQKATWRRDPQPGTTWTWDQPGITGPLVGCDGLGERQEVVGYQK
ncbi:unnamed protein product [Sphagnum jensenii]|uniref:Uncharacterized protein n=1 Tax=Sphagnum jensenii TaxID=128206 RepID=A0ABP1A685_9BRYO